MQRTAPLITDRTAAYWTGGAEGQLKLARCQACKLWMHPPLPVCRRCQSTEILFEPASERGTVWSFTVNHYQWATGMEPPYLIAEIELDEQPGLRLLATVVGCDEVTIGMPVTVRFERNGDAWVPVFVP
jgi:uncharacterized OB-fold protein